MAKNSLLEYENKGVVFSFIIVIWLFLALFLLSWYSFSVFVFSGLKDKYPLYSITKVIFTILFLWYCWGGFSEFSYVIHSADFQLLRVTPLSLRELFLGKILWRNFFRELFILLEVYFPLCFGLLKAYNLNVLSILVLLGMFMAVLALGNSFKYTILYLQIKIKLHVPKVLRMAFLSLLLVLVSFVILSQPVRDLSVLILDKKFEKFLPGYWVTCAFYDFISGKLLFGLSKLLILIAVGTGITFVMLTIVMKSLMQFLNSYNNIPTTKRQVNLNWVKLANFFGKVKVDNPFLNKDLVLYLRSVGEELGFSVSILTTIVITLIMFLLEAQKIKELPIVPLYSIMLIICVLCQIWFSSFTHYISIDYDGKAFQLFFTIPYAIKKALSSRIILGTFMLGILLSNFALVLGILLQVSFLGLVSLVVFALNSSFVSASLLVISSTIYPNFNREFVTEVPSLKAKLLHSFAESAYFMGMLVIFYPNWQIVKLNRDSVDAFYLVLSILLSFLNYLLYRRLLGVGEKHLLKNRDKILFKKEG
ncbi:MAG: hypothetical protein PWQ91_1051 [Eubacteriales bacterium]|nr:hypothetical protein [Eubacteriales bacterium]